MKIFFLRENMMAKSELDLSTKSDRPLPYSCKNVRDCIKKIIDRRMG